MTISIEGLKLEPLYDRLIVRILDEGDRTSSGLFRPQIAIDGTPYRIAEVVEAGHGRITSKGDTVPLRVQKGNVVVFFRKAGDGEQIVLPSAGDELLVIREAHVVGIAHGMDRVSSLTDASGKPMVVQ